MVAASGRAARGARNGRRSVLAVFDALDVGFNMRTSRVAPSFRALMDSHGSPGPVTEASFAGLGKVRDVMTKLAAAGAPDPDDLAHRWDIMAKEGAEHLSTRLYTAVAGCPRQAPE